MDPSPFEYLMLCVAAMAGGAVNSVAGGGTLLTFPVLFAALGSSNAAAVVIANGAVNAVASDGALFTVPVLFAALGSSNAAAAVVANATSTVALFPGSIAAMVGYRRELFESRGWAWLLLPPSLLGGLVGSMLVTRLPAESFKTMVPWLILTAALLFGLQPRLARLRPVPRTAARKRPTIALIVFQFGIAVYGGYFGAGIGILMLSGLAMMGFSDIHSMNSLKTLFASSINGVAVLVFIAEGKVNWPIALAMAAAAIMGGYLGAHVSRRLDRNLVRRGVVAIGFALSGYYLYQQAM